MCWNGTNNGVFSTKKAYSSLSEPREEEEEDQSTKAAFKMLCGSFAPMRVQFIIWKMLKQRLPTKVNLAKRVIITTNEDLKCPLCGAQDKNAVHLFFNYNFSTKIWHEIHNWMGVQTVPRSNPFFHFLQHRVLSESPPKGINLTTIWICTIWTIWKARNEQIFLKYQT